MSSPNDNQTQKRGRLKEDADAAAPKKKPKRQRLLVEDTTTLANAAFPNFLMNRDVASEIFSCLDIKSLYNITMSCKEGRNLLRHERVVRSALFQGGHAKTSMERLVPLIKRRCIWTPSPIRMLRLVNGKRCERCNQERVNLVSDSYGTFFCFHGCTKDEATKGVAMNKKWSPFVVDQPRIAKAAYESRAYIWKRPYTDTAGEQCGPLLSMAEMEGVIMRGQGTVVSVLEEKDAADPYASAVPDILKVYEDAKEAAERRAIEKEEKKRRASLDANAKKKNKLVDMIATLSSELGDVPWKELALAHTWHKHGNKETPRFHCYWVNELLHDFVKAPSKASKKKLKEVATSLKDSVSMLEEKGFLDFSFLSESNAVERGIKAFCQETYPVPHYKALESRWMSTDMLHRIQAGDDLFRELMTILPHEKSVMMAPVIVSSSVAISNDEMRTKAVSLGQILWRKEYHLVHGFGRLHSGESMHGKYQEAYGKCVETFPRLFQNTLDFLESPETIACKEKYRQSPLVSVRSQVDRVIDGVWHCSRPSILEALLTRDFEGAIKIVREGHIWDIAS